MSVVELRKLVEFIELIQGLKDYRMVEDFGLTSQFKEGSLFYGNEAFNTDFNFYGGKQQQDKHKCVPAEIKVLKAGDLVINNALQSASIVSVENSGKVMSANFTRVEMKSPKLDKYYFLYLFNTNQFVSKQKSKNTQGTAIGRISLNAISNLVIPLPSLEIQQQIGEIYKLSLKLQALNKRKAELTDLLTAAILNDLGE